MFNLAGWKTKTAGLGMILIGLGNIVTAVAPVLGGGEIDGVQLNAGLAMVGTGLGVIGIGHKIEKK